MSERTISPRAGVASAIAAYGIWGVAPLYFKPVTNQAPALEVLAHRIVWSAALLALLIGFSPKRRALASAAARSWRLVAGLLVTALLVGFNWYIFIWAIGAKQTLQASLGYFINPLVSVLLGVIFLGERLTLPAKVAVGFAAAGAGSLAIGAGELPLIALSLALTFAAYGLLRKLLHVDSVTGLAVETVLLLPVALAYLIWLGDGESGRRFGAVSWRLDLMLAFAGVMTTVPLLFFAIGARSLRLATMGLLQYIAPTGQFIVAVTVFHEPFDQKKLLAFALIWMGLAIYSADTLTRLRRLRLARGESPAILPQPALPE
jgi:chloramphenicol-sensitive protein RarD